MIRLRDLPEEKPLTLSQAADFIGDLIGKPPALTTVWRWCLKGTKGTKLESFCIGGQRFVTIAAIERFIERCSKRSDADATVAIDVTPQRSPEITRPTERRAQEIEAARQRLDELTGGPPRPSRDDSRTKG